MSRFAPRPSAGRIFAIAAPPILWALYFLDIAVLGDDREQLWNALVTGLGDYVRKNGFRSVVLGLSGGIDSAVCAVLAADALGAAAAFLASH